MPLRDWSCPSCTTMVERYYVVSGGKDVEPTCEKCGIPMEKAPLSAGTSVKTAVFPYTTTHISGDGSPVTVESLGHLRSLERTYGVCVTGFSQEPNNPDSPRDLPTGRPGGRDYEGPRAPWLKG